ncbi:MAG: DUF1284 domain-containing protein [Pseudomonadota bacterium]
MNETLEFRAHHLFCMPFIKVSLAERGKAFNDPFKEIIQSIYSGKRLRIKIAAGTDQLCLVCPDYKVSRCQSPIGDETQVHKWDAIILKELGLKAGDELPLEEFRSLIIEKAPLELCRRCQWQHGCHIGCGEDIS